jgi:uncharacterized membrane protein (DUF106 family)
MIEQITSFASNYPKTTIVIISLIVSFVSSLITKYTTDQELLKSINERRKEIQKEIKEKKYSETDKRFLKLQQEMLELSGTVLKHSFRPTLVTLIPFLILFKFLGGFFHPLIGNLWIWYYVLSSLLFSSLYRKILKLA